MKERGRHVIVKGKTAGVGGLGVLGHRVMSTDQQVSWKDRC